MDLLHRKHSSRRFGQPLSHVVVDRLLTLPRKIIDQFECLDFPVSDVVPQADSSSPDSTSSSVVPAGTVLSHRPIGLTAVCTPGALAYSRLLSSKALNW